MYRRPQTVDEGREYMKSALQRTKDNNTIPGYQSYWRAVEFVMTRSGFCDRLMTPLCQTSQVTSFLYNTLIPISERMLCEPEEFSKSVDSGLQDHHCPKHVEKMYTHIQDLIKAATHAKSRTDVDPSIHGCAEVVLELFANDDMCEALRLLAISSGITRIAFDISAPRMIHTFYHDTSLMPEGLNMDIMAKFAGLN